MKDLSFTFLNTKYLLDSSSRIIERGSGKEVPYIKFTDKNDDLLFLRNKLKINRGLFILSLYGKFSLPLELWEGVKVVFVNGDDRDYSVNNLRVYYLNKIMTPKENFYYIPGFERYGISEDGLVWDLDNSVFIKSFDEKENEYHYCHLEGRNKVLHRLLAIVFKNPPENYFELVVDHVNGKKCDHRLINLEWVTHRENNRRAFELGLRSDNKAVTVLDTFTGEVSTHFGSNEASKHIGVSQGSLSNCLKNNSRVVLKRYKVKYVNENIKWEDIIILPKGNSPVLKIAVRNVLTGETTVYPSIKAASRATSVFPVPITRQINANSCDKRITNGYEFKYDDESLWVEFSEHAINMFKLGLSNKTSAYEVTNVNTNEVQVYYGLSSVRKALGISKLKTSVTTEKSVMFKGIYLIKKLKSVIS